MLRLTEFWIQSAQGRKGRKGMPSMEIIFQSVLKGAKEVSRILRSTPLASQARAPQDVLVDAIPHWIYVGDTPLHLAAASLRPGIAKLLLDAGADANAVNRRGAIPLHYACDARPNTGAWSPEDQAAIIEILVQHGACLDRGDKGGATPLHRAVRARSPVAVRQLLALGAKVDCRLRTQGSTPLHLATQSTGAGGTAGTLDQQLQIIGLLREYGADAKAADASSRTPRDWARNARILEALQK